MISLKEYTYIVISIAVSPMIWIPNQLVGAPLGTEIKLECHIESSPRAIAFWEYNGVMVLNTENVTTTERYHSDYKLDSILTIRNLNEKSFGSYKCISKNSLGATDGTIMLYKMEQETEPNFPQTSVEEEEEEDEEDQDMLETNGIGISCLSTSLVTHEVLSYLLVTNGIHIQMKYFLHAGN